MSVERELLKRCEIAIIEGEDYLVGLLGDIQKLLAQPEQEPVAWVYEYAVRSSFDASFTGEWKEEIWRTKPDGVVKGFNPTKLESTVRNLVPLYTSPPTRQPLSIADVETHLLLCDDLDVGYIDGYIDGMVYAEREHKIRGHNE